MPDTSRRNPGGVDAVLVDVDGTLVDSNYHHTLAWHQAFRESGRPTEAWRIHRHIGMGGDRLVPAVAGEEFEKRSGDDVRAAWRRHADAALPEVLPFDGAHDLLVACAERGLKVVLASSGPAEHVAHYLELFHGRDVADAWTTADDVGTTKPAPDLLQVAMDKVGSTSAVVVGDSIWDAIAAQRLGLLSVALRSGGFSAEELTDAGAVEVFPSLPDLVRGIGRVLG
jgi:beta-phosphoglucomutase-like phosphatase (HAD superfamily)